MYEVWPNVQCERIDSSREGLINSSCRSADLQNTGNSIRQCLELRINQTFPSEYAVASSVGADSALRRMLSAQYRNGQEEHLVLLVRLRRSSIKHKAGIARAHAPVGLLTLLVNKESYSCEYGHEDDKGQQ